MGSSNTEASCDVAISPIITDEDWRLSVAGYVRSSFSFLRDDQACDAPEQVLNLHHVVYLKHGKSSIEHRSVLLLVVPPVVGQEPDLDVPVLVVGLSQELADGLPFGLQRCDKVNALIT